MKNTPLLILTCLIFIYSAASSQSITSNELQSTIEKGIKTAYRSSVRIWGYDTLSNQQMSAQFSGVVVTHDGHILTAAHTTIPGKTYKVMFSDGKEAIAMALGKIEYTENRTAPDVAMMKISTEGNWPYAEMARSSALLKNEPCISIAYPESLNQKLPTVRFGQIADVNNQYGFIQSTCIMEPGDSGGPLFDFLGRVIGIHSAIEPNEDLNYEIPIDLYRKYWTALQEPRVFTSLPEKVDKIEDESSGVEIERFANGIKLPLLSTKSANLQRSIVTITSKGKGETIEGSGTLISLKGIKAGKWKGKSIVIGKSSLVGNEPVINFGSTEKVAAKVLRRDQENDLILLVAETLIDGGIKVDDMHIDSVASKEIGRFLFSPLTNKVPKTSVMGSMLFELPKITSVGFLGAAIAPDNGKILLTRVMPESPAAISGLSVGDEIISINYVKMERPENYGEQLQKYWPGDSLLFEILKEGKIQSKQIVLTARPQPPATHPAELFEGGKSKRRDAFRSVFAHDARLTPAECGGPVFDLQGKFFGINIARFSRTTSIAIPSGIVRQFIINTLEI